MPHIFQDKVVVTYDELVPEHFTYDALRMTLKRSEKRGWGITRVMKGGRGRQLLVDFDTLPRQIRETFRDPRVADHPLEPYYWPDKQAIDFYTGYRYSSGHSLEDEIRDRYIVNASVLGASIRLREAREKERQRLGHSIKGVMRTIYNDVMTFNPTLKKKYGVQHTLPGNERRFQEKLGDFRREGYESLISKNLGNRNAAKTSEEIARLLGAIFAEPVRKPSYSDVARQYDAFLAGYLEVICPDTGEVYDPKEFTRLHKSTIYNFLSAWQSRIATHAVRSGDRQKYMGKYKPHHSLDMPRYAGSILSIDDRQPPFEYEKGKRMWFYNGIDLASSAFTCWVYGKSKEGIILDFYRQMVRNYHEWGLNLPAELECEASLNALYKDTFLREGYMFDYVRIEPNNARGKRIESYYRQLRYEVEKDAVGWLARPFALAEHNQKGAPVPLIPYDMLVQERLLDIERWNNMPHPRYPEMTRWEYFLDNQNPDLKPTNYKAFLRHLGYVTETSCNVGIIRLQRSEFLLGSGGSIATGEDLINLMKQIEGKRVQVHWLDDNDGQVMVAHVYMNNRFICEACAKPTYNRARIEQTDQDRANREIMSAYVATIEGFKNRGKKSLGKVELLPGKEKPQPKKRFRINGTARYEADEKEHQVEILAQPPDEYDSIDDNYDSPYKRGMYDRF